MKRHLFFAIALLATLCAAQLPANARAAAVPNDERAIAHALNRLAFGARPGDVERIKQIGLATWIEQQLQPQRIDNSALAPRLASLKTLDLDAQTVARDYFLPSRQARRQRQLAASKQGTAATTDTEMMAPPRPRAGNPQGDPPAIMQPELQRERQVIMELAQAKVLRAVYSDRQLEEVLVDFWFNHFNVFARKGQTGIYIGEYEREAIRPHVLGNFRELLGATAKHPAMLFYLDNWMSTDPNMAMPQGRGRRLMQQPLQQRPQRGLNENYARELLELHTLGVDGGYTQQDVIEVARAFTGWTIGPPADPGFRFVAVRHDRGEKKILGQVIRSGGGMEDGERVLDLLADHPSTAKHIAFKLSQRFVSDTPPPALVTRAAARFRATKGDLREVVRTIVTSPEFFARDAYRAKVKTPFEFVASALRATGTDLPNAMPVMRALQTLGMPLYLCQPPTGYDETSATWVSSGALVNRMNFAVQLSTNSLRAGRGGNARARSQATTTTTGNLNDARERLLREALMGDASAATKATVAKATTYEQMVALVIGSPEFQRQ